MNDVTITEPQTRATDWKQQVNAWKRSGLSQNQFCKANDLSYHRFVYWRGKFEGATRGRSTQDAGGGFTAVNCRAQQQPTNLNKPPGPPGSAARVHSNRFRQWVAGASRVCWSFIQQPR